MSSRNIAFENLEDRRLFAQNLFGGATLLDPKGLDPQASAVADVNNDGRPDIVAANYEEGSVATFLNRGKGKFSAAIVSKADTSISSLVVADFNGDGKTDIATAGVSLNIAFGSGDGHFDTKQVNHIHEVPQSIAVGDFNRDGKPDLAVTDVIANEVVIALNDGKGKMGMEPLVFDAGTAPVGIVAVDLNGDKKLDLAIADMGNDFFGDPGVSVLYGLGNGSFKPRQVFSAGSRPVGIAAGDLNGDRRPDLVVTNGGLNAWDGEDTVSVLLNDKSKPFRKAKSYKVGPVPEGVTLGDFNSDGKLDVLVGNYRSDHVSLLLGNGNGTFGAEQMVTGASGNAGVTAADLNGDHKLDLIFTASTAGRIGVKLHK